MPSFVIDMGQARQVVPDLQWIMFPAMFARHALKTRATLLILLIFVSSLWSLTLYTSHMLRRDLHQVLAQHQDHMVTILATQLSKEMGDRAMALTQFASILSRANQPQADSLRTTLGANPLFQDHFNGGSFITDSKGVSVADSSPTGVRLGVNYQDRDYIREALTGRPVAIGKPTLGRVINAPIVGLAAPLLGPGGDVVGALAGVIALERSAFLDDTVHPRISEPGSFCIVDRRYRQIVLCSDHRANLQALDVVGRSAQMERYLAGEEGSSVMTRADGTDSLSSARAVAGTPWLVIGLLPVTEAFSPVTALQYRMVGATFVLTLIACLLTWWMLRKHLSPLLDAAARLSQISVAQALPPPLPVERNDEVGELFSAFNRMLKQLGEHDRALKESEERFRLGFENANVGMCLVDLQGRLTRVNRQMCVMFGYSHDEMESMGVDDIAHPDSLHKSTAFMDQAQAGIVDHTTFEKKYLHKDGHTVHGFVSSTLLRDPSGKPLGFISHVMDITQQKMAQTKLQLAANVFTHAREGIIITDALGNIMDVNTTFTDITGYTREEVLGRNPSLLASGQQDAAFYKAMWGNLKDRDYWSGEVWNRRKNGEMFAEMLTISAVRGAGNAVIQYVALFSDITERKALEEQVRQLAFHDPLTLLPNRRLLRDRLSQALAQSARNAQFGAVLFMDLDNFKPLNDAYGHGAGDLLLIEVANRLKRAVRGIDTVARIGGDEFVVVLGELGEDRDAASVQALAVAEKIRLSLAETYQINLSRDAASATWVEHQCTASLGLALYGQHDLDAEALLKWADTAMYEAKALGRNRVQLYQGASA